VRRSFQLENDHLILPNGRRVPLKHIEDWAQSAHDGRQYITPKLWHGWRIVQQYLVPPGRKVSHGIHVRHMRFLALRIDAYQRQKRSAGLRDA